MKITPRTDILGDFTIQYTPPKHPVPEATHLHLRWAEEKCPYCESALMMYYPPTFKHQVGMSSVSKEKSHRQVYVSCIACNFSLKGDAPFITRDNAE